MNFGWVDYVGLKEETFLFSPKIKQLYLHGSSSKPPLIYIGLPKWTDVINDANRIPQKDALNEYIKQFNSVELNATHYNVDTAEIIKWASKANGSSFKFCPKFPRAISNSIGLKDLDLSTKDFVQSIRLFGNNLGSVLLTLHDKFSSKNKIQLIEFLKSLPTDISFFLEIRHPDWFNDSDMIEEFTHTLHQLNIGLVITDTPGRRDVLHLKLSIPKTFIRFVCQGDLELDRQRIINWKQLLQNSFGQGLEECYFFLHVRDKKSILPFAKFVQEKFKDLQAVHI